MRGFDRPLKPRWIYEFIEDVEVGDKISNHDQKFREITWELDGEVGRRKVRTVLSRYFLKEQSNPRSKTVDNTAILKIVKNLPLEDCKPLMLFNLLVRSKLIRTISKMMYDIYGPKNEINYNFLRKKIIEKYGERDISARSLRNFLHTFVNFDVFEEEQDHYKWKSQIDVNEEQLVLMLMLYSREYLNSPQIILRDLEEYIFMYFNTPEIAKVAKQYDNHLWKYSKMLGKAEIVIDESQNWYDIQETLFENNITGN